MLMLLLIRNGQSIIRRADERDYRLPESRGRELRDLTVGVVGAGRIGTAVIHRLRGFGGRILTHDVRPGAEGEHVPLDDLLRRSDVVTLHTPLTTATHHLLDAAGIGLLKPGALIVNTSRGALVDTGALLGALELGRVGGAALDVVEGEEGQFYEDLRNAPARDNLLSRLQAHPNVIISSHTAFHTDHALRDTVEQSLLNCLRFERGVRHG
jgi:D-specific alpha-keto acid dehydrogenase